jgi:excisionase family DNA binding protein
MVQIDEETLLTISEAHRRLPISLPQLYHLVRTKKIPSIEIGKRLFIKEQVIIKILDEGSTPYFSTHRSVKCPA